MEPTPSAPIHDEGVLGQRFTSVGKPNIGEPPWEARYFFSRSDLLEDETPVSLWACGPSAMFEALSTR